MMGRILASMLVLLSVSNVSLGEDLFTKADAKLNENYQAVMSKLPASMQESLRDAQRLWIRYTNANCEFELSLDAQLFKKCQLDETVKRSAEFSRLLKLMDTGSVAEVAPEFTAHLKDVLANLAIIPTEESEGIYWPGGSAHTIVTQLLKKISMNYLVNQYGKPIFLEGPHTDTSFQLQSLTKFGHYDPAFLTWLDQHLDQILAERDFVERTKSVVSRYLLGTVELYLTSYYYLINNPEIRDEILLDYMMKYKDESLDENHHRAFFIPSLRKDNPDWNGEAKSEQYIWYYPEATTQFDWILTRMNEKWQYLPVGSAIMFWMRRSIDGTDQQFVDLLTKFYRGYDADKYDQDIDQRLFKAPKSLPIGEIQF